MARTLLFLSAENFQVYLWNSKGLSLAHEYSNDADGREQFSAFLVQHRNPTYLLVDIIEEDFHLETIPHLIGPSRTALIERKFEQYYRSTPFRQATLLKRQEEGRRDDEYLFSALTNPQRITPWLDALLEHHIPLVGIYSIPNISAPLLKTIPSEHILLMTWERNAGLRQTYFHDKRLHFSRLIPINENGTLIDAVVSETPRTQQYLKSLSLPPPGEVLEIFILCHTNEIEQLRTRLSSDGEQHFNYLNIAEFAAQHKCKQELNDSDSTPLFLNLLASKPPSTHYASTDHIHFYMLWQLRFVLFGLSFVILLIGLLWSGMSYVQSEQFAAETEPLKQQTRRVQSQAQSIQSQFANTQVPAADMKTAVLLARSLDQYSPPLQEILYELSKALENFPRISLNKLSWRTSPEEAAPSPYPAQVITFDGSLAGFGSDHRGALTYLEKFEQSLIQRGYAVRITNLPLDITSKGIISGQSAETAKGDFTLKITWRAPS